MAKRMGANTIEIDSSHVAMISHPPSSPSSSWPPPPVADHHNSNRPGDQQPSCWSSGFVGCLVGNRSSGSRDSSVQRRQVWRTQARISTWFWSRS
jgi:hypothetical protein